MEIKLNVHAVTPKKIGATVQLDGVDARADVDSLEVELVAANSRHGSITLRFTGADIVEAQAKFIAGETLTWTV